MLARLWPVCLFGLLVVAPLPAAGPQPAATPRPAPPPDALAAMLGRLRTRIDDPEEPREELVADYVARLSQRHGIRIVLDPEAYQQAGMPNVNEHKVSFPAPKGIRLLTLLQSLGGAISAGADGERDPGLVLVYDTHVVIAPGSRVWDVLGVSPDNALEAKRPVLPLLTVLAADQPLADVFAEVGEVYGVNVALTQEAAKAAEARVRVRLLNAPLDTGLATLARLAGLTVHRSDNVFLVTTPEQAKALRDAAPPPPQFPLLLGLGGAGCCFPFPAGLGASAAPRFLSDPVTAHLTKARLDRTLAGWAAGGATIVIDPAAGKKAEAEVTANLTGVSCEAAVKVLAELAGLRAVRLDNALLVTTPEKVAQLTPPAAPAKRKKK